MEATLSTEIISKVSRSADRDFRFPCPSCSADRKKPNDPCLSVKRDGDDILYHCWHCTFEGRIRMQREKFVPLRHQPAPVLAAGHAAWLKARGISQHTAEFLGMFSDMKFFNRSNAPSEAIGFPYREHGAIYAVKYRAVHSKDFTQEGSARTFFAADKIIDTTGPLVICEGEIDCASFWESGIPAVSVPSGAPIQVSEGKIDPREDKKFSYIWAEQALIKSASKIILAADNDGPGQALAEEIARRVGKARCYRVEYPTGAKDANDLLRAGGKEALVSLIANAQPWPVAGLYSAFHYAKNLLNLYDKGEGKGFSTGYLSFDPFYTIVPGQVSIVTGTPGAGKSELIDQIMINLAEKEDWKFAICSFENPPATHLVKLIEKRARRPFYEPWPTRLQRDQIGEYLSWIDDHFAFIDQSDGEPATIPSILDRAKAAVMRLGIRGLVIDPYNYLDRDPRASETDYISTGLTKVQEFAKGHEVHVWFVAHPFKLRAQEDGTTPIPKGYDISGSAAWFAKADFGLTVHRTPEQKTQLHVWKCRNKWAGMLGIGEVDYDIETGRYSEPRY